MQLSRSVEIDAPPEVVWAVWSDVERWPEWTPSVSRVERLDPGPLAVGQRVRVRQPKFPTAVWRVTSVEPARSFSWVAESPGARVTGMHRIEPRPDGGSRATMGLRFEGPVARLVAWLTRARTDHNLDLEAAGLKRRSEARAAARGGVD